MKQSKYFLKRGRIFFPIELPKGIIIRIRVYSKKIEEMLLLDYFNAEIKKNGNKIIIPCIFIKSS